MEENKGFGMPTGRSRLCCILLRRFSPGRIYYYLYGIGAFAEVAFVAMLLKAGMDTGVYGAVAFGASFCCRIIEGSLVGILDIGRGNSDRRGLRGSGVTAGAGFVFPGLYSYR